MSATKQTFPDYAVVKSTDMAIHSPEAGLVRRVGAYNEQLFLAEHRMQKGWVGARHQHPHDQVVFVVTGQLSVVIGNEAFVVNAGDSFVVRGGIEHQATALADAVVLDVFTPCREDYL